MYIFRFQLLYYSNTAQASKEARDTVLTVDTRGLRVSKSREEPGEAEDCEEAEQDPIAMAIQSKLVKPVPGLLSSCLPVFHMLFRWEGALVDWAGIPKYV